MPQSSNCCANNSFRRTLRKTKSAHPSSELLFLRKRKLAVAITHRTSTRYSSVFLRRYACIHSGCLVWQTMPTRFDMLRQRPDELPRIRGEGVREVLRRRFFVRDDVCLRPWNGFRNERKRLGGAFHGRKCGRELAVHSSRTIWLVVNVPDCQRAREVARRTSCRRFANVCGPPWSEEN